MNQRFSVLVDFTVRVLIIIVGVFLVMNMLFMPEFKRIATLVESLDAKVHFYEPILISNNPEVVYIRAVQKIGQGDVAGAQQDIFIALKLSELNARKYQETLSELMKRAQNQGQGGTP
jgi:hypothetical protein